MVTLLMQFTGLDNLGCLIMQDLIIILGCLDMQNLIMAFVLDCYFPSSLFDRCF